MGEVQWIKFYIDMFDKRKINKIRRLPDGDRILLFWVMLLAMAGKCNAGGMIFITEKMPFTHEVLRGMNLKIFDSEITNVRDLASESPNVVIETQLPRRRPHVEIIAALAAIEGVISVEEL